MPLDSEFLHHLHELMVEVSDDLADEEGEFKRQLIGKALKKNNLAAMPIAYKDAAIHAFRNRVGKTIEKYIEALSLWDIEIDAVVEKEMMKQITRLTAGPNSLTFPPAFTPSDVQAVQSSFAMERQRVAHQLVRSGANRLREAKLKSKQAVRTINGNITNNFNGPVGSVYNNSIHHSTSRFAITPPILEDIDRISEGNPQLEAAARQIHAVSPQNASMLERTKNWIVLLTSIDGLTEKVVQHYPQIEALIKHFTHP
jgi:hypothetical protein